ncbi:XRE family transcriptional regulator, partial [Lacticaseibacillus rhamnosus MTCC 5462]
TASLIMTGVAATTFLGFFPHWLTQVIWSIYAIVLLIWSRASDPKSTDILQVGLLQAVYS